jgi:hypothetical protein
MRALRFGTVVAVLGLTACSQASPPATRVGDIAGLAGTYSGTVMTGTMDRPAWIVMLPDGRFEITVPDPGGSGSTGSGSCVS